MIRFSMLGILYVNADHNGCIKAEIICSMRRESWLKSVQNNDVINSAVKTTRETSGVARDIFRRSGGGGLAFDGICPVCPLWLRP